MCDRGVRFQSVCRPRLVRVLRNLPPPISAHLGLSMSDRSPPVARPSEARRQAHVPSVESPCLVRGKSAAAPPPISECRKMSASDECPPVSRRSEVRRWPVESPPRPSHVRRWTRRRPQSAASPCEPPRTNATRTNTRRTPHRTRPNAERTTDEHRRARSTCVPLKDDGRDKPVCRP